MVRNGTVELALLTYEFKLSSFWHLPKYKAAKSLKARLMSSRFSLFILQQVPKT
jgi:hypothetical protein